MLTVVAFRIALLFLKYRQIAKRITVRKPDDANPGPAPHVLAWCVKQTARIVPFASCLTQALALQHLLARCGVTSVIRVGVRVNETNKVDAHAWVMIDDWVLIGNIGHDLSQYSVLTDLEPSHAS
ncbi:MAG: lasso peptide biosynthesis B2 protein [Pseudomonadota bacterium]